MNTKLAYFENTYQFQGLTCLQSCHQDENGYYLILNQTLFYPQGGGQPSDSGYIKIDGTMIPIHKVKYVENEVRHYTDKDHSVYIGQEGLCIIDEDKRLHHAKLHTAGHLIAHIVEQLYPQWIAIKGHHFPDQCYVEFASKDKDCEAVSVDNIHRELFTAIQNKYKVCSHQYSKQEILQESPHLSLNHISDDMPIRTIRIDEFTATPCGGTHIKNLGELEGLMVTQGKIKKGILKTSYDITS